MLDCFVWVLVLDLDDVFDGGVMVRDSDEDYLWYDVVFDDMVVG